MATATLNSAVPPTMASPHFHNDTPSRAMQPFAPSPIMIPNKHKKNICQKEHLKSNMDSPNRNGCYDFDRVIKSGELLKRTRKTKGWKPVHLVLRPNLLCIYKDQEYTKLRHRVPLYDLTAVARQRDPKDRVKYIFGLFSPSRNFHLSAQSEADAQSWVEHIRREARIDEADEEMILMSPGATAGFIAPFGIRDHAGASSSEEPDSAISHRRQGQGHARNRSATLDNHQMHSARRTSSTLQNFSGNEAGSYSDFSDPGVLGSAISLGAIPAITSTTSASPSNVPAPQNGIYGASPPPKRPTPKRNASHMSTTAAGASPQDDRVIYQGHLHLLKSHHGVRQWRTVWAVLRRKTFTIYKNEDEYSAQLVMSFEQLVDAVEIDPQSKSKRECFQLIGEERTYRFCALSERELDRWLGAFKSLLAKRREGQIQIKTDAGGATGISALSLGSPVAVTLPPASTALETAHASTSIGGLQR